MIITQVNIHLWENEIWPLYLPRWPRQYTSLRENEIWPLYLPRWPRQDWLIITQVNIHLWENEKWPLYLLMWPRQDWLIITQVNIHLWENEKWPLYLPRWPRQDWLIITQVNIHLWERMRLATIPSDVTQAGLDWKAFFIVSIARPRWSRSMYIWNRWIRSSIRINVLAWEWRLNKSRGNSLFRAYSALYTQVQHAQRVHYLKHIFKMHDKCTFNTW